jgi:hypothetical protein
MIIQRHSLFLEILPINIIFPLAVFHHGNAILNWTNQAAKITSHTLIFLDGVSIIRLAPLEVDGLVRRIFTTNIT